MNLDPLAKRDRLRVTLALVAVQVFFGVHYLASKEVVAEMAPRAYAMLRIWGAALVMLAFTRASGRRLPRSPGAIGRLAIYAIFGIVLNQVLFAEGIARTTPIHAALINTTIPLTTLVIALMLGRERVGWRRGIALAIGLAGAWLVIRPDAATIGGASVTGDLLIVGNATSFSLFLVLSRPLMQRVEAFGATTVLLLWGALGISVVGIGPLLATDLGSISTGAWLWLAFAALFPTAGGYVLQYWALTKVPSSTVAFFIYLQPLVAASLSVAVYGERPGWHVAVGAALIFAGVFITQVRTRVRR